MSVGKDRAHIRCPSWRKGSSQRARIDDGAASLGRLGNAIEAKAQQVFRGNVLVSAGPVGRCRATDLDNASRIICADIGTRAFWCIISDDIQRQLLECILEGPGSIRPTPVECAILEECLDNLLTAASGASWREAARHLAFDEELWRCGIQISRGQSSAVLDVCTRAVPRAVAKPLRLDGIPLSLVASLASLRTSLGALAELKTGAKLPLGADASALLAVLTIAGGPVLYGSLGQLAGRRAIRLSGSGVRSGGT